MGICFESSGCAVVGRIFPPVEVVSKRLENGSVNGGGGGARLGRRGGGRWASRPEATAGDDEAP